MELGLGKGVVVMVDVTYNRSRKFMTASPDIANCQSGEPLRKD